MCSQQFNNRFFRLRRFCLPTLLAALLVVTTVSCRKESPQSKSVASSTASLVSDEALFHVEVSDLGKIVLGLAKSVQEIAATVPESQQNFRVVKDFIEKKLGINPLSLAEYEKIGIDLTKPVGFSLLPNHKTDGLSDELHGVIHVAVTDSGKVIDLLKRILADVDASINKLEGNGGMFYTVKDHGKDVIGLAFHRGYVSIIFADVRADYAFENYLPRYMAAAKKNPLEENKQYQRTSENFTPDSLARLFVNLQVAVNMFEEEESVSIPLFQEFLAVGASVGAQEVRTSLQMTADSGLLKLIKPGDSCQDLLANAETPMAAFSMSLADPLAVVEYVIRHMEEEREQGNAMVEDFKRDIQRLPEELAVSYPQVRKSVAPLSAAVLIYPEFVDLGELFGVPLRVPEVVGLLKMQEQGLAKRLLTFAFPEGERETHGQSTLYVIPGVVAGSVDGHLVAGTAMDRIRTIASEEAESWKPFVGDSQLFAAEVDMLAVQQAVIAQQEMPRVVELSINSLMKKMLKSKLPLKVKTERLKDGVMTSVDLGSFQVDRQILKLIPQPIHMMLEEMSEEIGR